LQRVKTQTLLRISLATSVIGLFLLFIVAENLEPKLIQISEVDGKQFDSYVKIRGEILDVKKTPGLYILSVEDSSEKIDIIIFRGKETISFAKGSIIEVIGKVSEFRGKLQIEAVEIRENVS